MVATQSRHKSHSLPFRLSLSPRVLLLSEKPSRAAAIARYLTKKGFAVVLVSSSGQGESEAQRSAVDALLVDLSESATPEWATLASRISCPAIVLTQQSEEHTTRPAGDGVQFLRKPVSGESVARALAAAVTGAARPAHQTGAPKNGGRQLSPREHQALQLLVEGASNRHIAEQMGLREPTVKKYVQRIMEKLGATDRTQAAAIAVRAGLVQ
jgi:DNA-binding NarL/FixJ family response regulator